MEVTEKLWLAAFEVYERAGYRVLRCRSANRREKTVAMLDRKVRMDVY
jgi:hypothetical protein